jgi:hypothetical protein
MSTGVPIKPSRKGTPSPTVKITATTDEVASEIKTGTKPFQRGGFGRVSGE